MGKIESSYLGVILLGIRLILGTINPFSGGVIEGRIEYWLLREEKLFKVKFP